MNYDKFGMSLAANDAPDFRGWPWNFNCGRPPHFGVLPLVIGTQLTYSPLNQARLSNHAQPGKKEVKR